MRRAIAPSLEVVDNTANNFLPDIVTLCALFSLFVIQPEMKTAVLEFHRNRVKRQQSGAASLDIVKTIGELRSALHRIGKTIEVVERLAAAQAGEAARKQRASKAKRKGKVVSLPRLPEVRDDQPAPESTGAQT